MDSDTAPTRPAEAMIARVRENFIVIKVRFARGRLEINWSN